MAQSYVPEILNELTRIVITTRNRNPSVEEYDLEVPKLWKRCEEIQTLSRNEGRPPSAGELQEVAAAVARMLRVKHVPEGEIAERLEDALSRAGSGPARVDVALLRRAFQS